MKMGLMFAALLIGTQAHAQAVLSGGGNQTGVYTCAVVAPSDAGTVYSGQGVTAEEAENRAIQNCRKHIGAFGCGDESSLKITCQKNAE